MPSIDWRILIVIGPLLVAGSWALFNIGSAALTQARAFLDSRDS